MRTGEWVVAENWRLCSTTLVRGVVGELEDENWRLGSTTLVRRAAGEWEDEIWRLGSTTLVRRVAGEWEDENSLDFTIPQLTRLHTSHCTLTG